MQHHHSVDASGVFSGPVGADLRAKLASDENVLAALQVDLSADLRFVSGWVVVTSRRLLACDPGATVWRDWALAPGLSLKLQDHGGVGTLELHNPQERVAFWRFTLGHHPQALRLVQRFEQQVERGAGQAATEEEEPACPVCHTPLPPDTDECPACARAQAPQTSTWVLLRLWRFARPYRKQLAAGFALTMASTAATLVPPYLTIPLMDDILIPYQNGQTIDPWLVLTYLGGLLLAALAAWGLSWARTYILALVSERIGADLRTTTYEHLLRLSLDYFGGKRTGDLMARILLAEDDDGVRAFVSRALAHMGHDVTEAEDGGLAAEICAERNGEFDLLLSAWTGRPDPSMTYSLMYSKDAYFNAGRVDHGQKLTDLLAESRVAERIEGRKLIFWQLQRIVMEQALVAPLAFQYELVAASQQVKGYKPNLLGKPKYEFISKA